jgi:hypothetical protein
MTQRLRVIYNNTGKGKTRYELSKKYFEKLKKETKKKSKSRKKSPKRKSKRKSKSRRKSPKRKSKSRRKSPKRKSKSRRKSPKRKSKSRRKSPKRKSKRKSKSRRKSPKRKSKRKSKSRRKSPKRKSKSYRKKSAVWSQKYKNSINCNRPKGFSQRAHCQSLKKKSIRRKSKKKSNMISSIEYCTIKARLSDQTIIALRKLCEEPEKNGQHNEKASSMRAIKGGTNIYTIEINHDDMIKGDEVGVDIVPGLYNFHTHPRNAYKIYNVKLGWPSGQDYIGFLLAFVEDDTIFHIVATLEGIYIISIHKDWFVNKKFTEKIGDFINKNYTFSYKEGDTIDGYLNKINNIKYNDSDRIFIVKFFPWEKADNVFTISYAKVYDKCFTCEKEKEKYKKQMKLK